MLSNGFLDMGKEREMKNDANTGGSHLPLNPNAGIAYDKSALKDIWFAGGCFWGVQAYFARIYGVAETTAGYANGKTEHPSYYDLHDTGHAETVHVRYDSEKVSLQTLINSFFRIIDPTSVNRQGADVGTQYRSGIYYESDAEFPVISAAVADEQKKHNTPVATEIKKLTHYYLAEDYHQDYLENNPGGYCHVNFSALRTLPRIEETHYQKPKQEELEKSLSSIQYLVTQKSHTEPPFDNIYWNQHEQGIYVDIATGEPLFLSTDKFDSGCGWPSFSKPIDSDVLKEISDESHGMRRTEVRSRTGDSHLGHLFLDGPKEFGGLRYCINSAALRFIPLAEMGKAGYAKYIPFVK